MNTLDPSQILQKIDNGEYVKPSPYISECKLVIIPISNVFLSKKIELMW